MFSKKELSIIQMGLMENVFEFVRKEHEVGVVNCQELKDDWKMLKEMDTKHMLDKVANEIPEFESPKPADEMFEDMAFNVSIFEQMQMIHKIDEILGEDLTFHYQIDASEIKEFGWFEKDSYNESFAEYFNHFIALFAVWEEGGFEIEDDEEEDAD